MAIPEKIIGEKIRELRLQRGITQKDLAGDKITRNMLSLIESGNASPSVSTLLYISKRLDTPVGYFFSNTEEDEGRFLKMSIIEQIKSSFHSQNYAECAQLCVDIPPAALDDEISYILAVSYLNTSLQSAYHIEMDSAFSDLKKAEQFSSCSIYCTSGFTSAIEFYQVLYSTACSDVIPDILCDYSKCGDYVSYDVIEYFNDLKLYRTTGTAEKKALVSSHFSRHINALHLASTDHTVDAQKRLRELSLDPTLPFFMQYRVLCDLENAANISGDLRLAYSSARRKIELIEKFRK
ncbi:MAG: helix-turn-helix transcriptional regulator [Ruminococcaceae bacterium]|nr:helix-turn-helix transcriptional regulator [Oscillospiraceae bacterium]